MIPVTINSIHLKYSNKLTGEKLGEIDLEIWCWEINPKIQYWVIDLEIQDIIKHN